MIIIEHAQTRNLKWNHKNTKHNLINYLTPHSYAFGKSKLLKITFIFFPGTCIGQIGEAVLVLREPSCLVQVEGQLYLPLCSGPMVLPLILGNRNFIGPMLVMTKSREATWMAAIARYCELEEIRSPKIWI